jgi:putative DNA primase/helicase
MNEYKPKVDQPASPAPKKHPVESAAPPRPQLVVEVPKRPEPDEPTLLYFDLNDHGNAQRVAAIYGPSMRYCHAFKKWLLWDGWRWRVDETEQARRWARLVMVKFLAQAVSFGNPDDYRSEASRLRDFASSSINARGITDMLITLRSDPEIVIEPGELDTHPYLLNCLNGTVDLRTGGLGPHNPEHYITKLVHHHYRPEAKCQRWLRFISEVMSGNQELVSYLQKALGYSLTGCTIEKAVFVLFGDGNNGKTTLLSTIRTLIQEYATLVQVDSLMTRSEESNNVKADLADLRGARFAMTSESEQGQSLSPAKLKRITQGMGMIKSVRKYENPIEFPETHKLWLDTNQKPNIPDADDTATFNRLHPIPFTVIVPREKIDRDLPGKLLEEAEGILAWAVEGAMLWHRHGLDKPAVVKSATEQWREESDWAQTFIEERCVIGDNFSAGADELFQAYRGWASESGKKPCSRRAFAEKMKGKGFDKTHKEHGTLYLGIQIA